MTAEPAAPAARSRLRGSVAVSAGILASRFAGLLRQVVFAAFLGSSAGADVFTAAFRIPNVLQNLLGEGAVSASFIPVYRKLVASERPDRAVDVASAVGTLLAVVTGVFVALGMLFAPWLVDLLAGGFEAGRRAETLALVRVFLPGIGLLVLSAWCLGILNSHRRFFLPYAAPVVSSACVIVALLLARHGTPFELARAAAYGTVAGALLQLLVQLPPALRLVPGARPTLGLAVPEVAEIIARFGPALLSRGVAQLSGYIDQYLASWLGKGAVATLGYAQVINLLPVSLFGTAISAAELTEMSSATGSEEEVNRAVAQRLSAGLRRIAFFVVPSAVAFLALGDQIVGLLYQRGAFTRAQTLATWATLAGSAVGLLGQTMARLYTSAFNALGDTRTPMRVALLRLGLTGALGYAFAFPLVRALHLAPSWGTVGLTASAGIAGWSEYAVLRAALARRVGAHGLALGVVVSLWVSAALAAAIAWVVRLPLRALVGDVPLLVAPPVLAVFGAAYLALTLGLDEPQAVRLAGAIRRRLKR